MISSITKRKRASKAVSENKEESVEKERSDKKWHSESFPPVSTVSSRKRNKTKRKQKSLLYNILYNL